MTDETTPDPKPAHRTMRLKNPIDTVKLKGDLSIGVDLNGSFMEQAALYAHYAECAGAASRQVDDLKLLLEVHEAKVYRILRDQAVTSGAKITEVMLEKSVAVHPQIVAIKRALNEARQIESTAKGVSKAMEHKKDMLVQLGAGERKQREGELRMNFAAAREEEREIQRQAQRERIDMLRGAARES